MRAEFIAARYVRAFLQNTGVDPEKTTSYLSAFALLERLFVQKIISRFFSCPVVRVQEKREVLQLFFTETSVETEVQNFLLALLDADRGAIMPFLRAVYQEELQKKLQIVPVRIVSAFPLSEAEKLKSADRVQKAMSRKSQIDFETDEALLGGIVVFVGHLKVDLSLQNKIKQVVNSVRA
jgi:F-type H+-transporting ATPase subunit delta